MCEKCLEIDATIIRYRRIKDQISDRRIREAAAELITKLKAEKQDLHPEQK